jgi:hypothetical protein
MTDKPKFPCPVPGTGITLNVTIPGSLYLRAMQHRNAYTTARNRHATVEDLLIELLEDHCGMAEIVEGPDGYPKEVAKLAAHIAEVPEP